MPAALKPSTKPDFYGDDSLISQISTEKFKFKPELTSLHMVSTPYKFQLTPNRYVDRYISSVSKQLAPFEH